MSDINFELPREATRIWDLDVPIVVDQENNNVKAYISGPIEEPFVYNELCYLLSIVDKSTKVEVFLNTPGGIIDSALMLSNAIKTSAATVTAHLSGTVASAGTLISMACDELVVAPHLSFMIHNYSGGLEGKGHEMKARQKFIDQHLNDTFKEYYSGFLTTKEMNSVIEGVDIWMGSEEVKKRWNNRIKQTNVENA